MPKYQLADQVNGIFGETYATMAEAEAAMADLVAELLPVASEEVRLEEEAAAEAAYRDTADFTDDEIASRAEDRIRAFHSIEEIEDDDR